MHKIATLLLLPAFMSSAAHAIIADKSSRIGKGAYGAAIVGYSDSILQFNKEIVPKSGIVREHLGSLDTGVGIGYMGSYKQILLGVEIVAGYAWGTKLDDDNQAGRKIDLRRGIFGEVVGKLGWKFNRTGVYALGGFTRTNFRVGTTDQDGGDIIQSGKFYQGPLFGAGIMYNLIDRLSPRFEYQHIRFVRAHLPVVTPGLSVKVRANIYHFALVYHL